MRYLIKNARVVDPLNKVDAVLDLLISGEKIEALGKDLDGASAEVIDAKGKLVAPGLVDMHAHLREPGREDEETIASGSRAAIRGGYTSVACMPNTEPAIDSPKAVKALKSIITRDALINVLVVGAITRERRGKEAADVKGMKAEGIVAISDDGSSVEDARIMSAVLKEAKSNSLFVMAHCEDIKLSAGGVINAGFIATRMGLHGAPKAAEYERVKRDLALAEEESSHIHIAHLSCKESVDLIRKAKRGGLKVSAETAPHYFSLTEDCCVTYDTSTKMNPPLRTTGDVKAIKAGLKDGTIDAIATDHAPHTDSEKCVEFDFAPFGIIGLETALSLAVAELVEKDVLSWGELILKMSSNPARILGIDGGTLKAGSVADIVVINPTKEYSYKRESIESKSRNSPFIGWKLKARVTNVFVRGKLVMKDEVIL